jgi:ketosteroid isomerase-like protein
MKSRRVSALLALALAGVACPLKGTVAPPVVTPTIEPERPLDRADLELDLQKSIRETYSALSKGYDESYLEFLAHDQRLVLVDVGPTDVMVGFAESAVAQTRRFPDRGHQVHSKRLEVHVSADGTAGWSFDELSYRVLHEGRRVIIPMRATAAYERRGGRWLLVQQHVSYGIPDDELWAYAASGRPGTPKLLGDFTAPGVASGEVRAIMKDVLAGGEPPFGETALVIGTDSDIEYRGPAAIAHASLRGLFGERPVVAKDLRVKASATGQIAWAAADLVVTGEWEGKPAELPVRVTWILERQTGGYRVVQMHVSVPVTADELSLRALGVTLT